MDFNKFIALDEESKLRQISKVGVRIGRKQYQKHSTFLYQIEGFYVEVHKDKFDSHIITIRCFNSTVPLEPYLETIPLSRVLKRTIVLPFFEVLDIFEPMLLSVGF